jgi:hypothetical protein
METPILIDKFDFVASFRDFHGLEGVIRPK